MFRRRKNYSDEDLVADILKGGHTENQAIGWLLQKYEEKVRAFLLTKSGSAEDAEDVLQDAIVALILNIRKGKFEGNSAVGTYLISICKNIWYSKFAKKNREEKNKNSLDKEDELTIDPELVVMEKERKESLINILNQLKPKCRKVLMMWGEGYPMDEIAKALEFGSAQVAMNKKSRCMKELDNLITNHPEILQALKDLLEWKT